MSFFSLLLSLITGYLAPTSAIVAPLSEDNKAVTEHIAWTDNRRLSWDDFKATPDSLNPHHALTAANLAVDAKCVSDKFTYTVKCVFLATESWSKNKQSQKLLQHEQLHFDLTEVHARQLRKKLQTLGTSCPDAKARLTDAVNKAFATWKAEQDKFDEVSQHGLNVKESAAWATNIQQRLEQLNKYKI